MSLWQLRAAVAGFAKANGAEMVDVSNEDIEAITATNAAVVARSAQLHV